MDNTDKLKTTVWLTPETNSLVTAYHKLDGCDTRSIFVEKAIRFYVGYITSNKSSDYLSVAVSDSVDNKLNSFENRMAKLLFKYSVEQAIMMNIVAAFHKVEKPQIDILRGQCIEEIKRTRGKFNFADAMDWQHGDDDE